MYPAITGGEGPRAAPTSPAVAGGDAGVVVREEAPGDIAGIDAVTRAAFLDAPRSSHTEHLIVAALRRAAKLTVSLVAEVGGAIVGHVAASPVDVGDGTPDWFGLGPVSVMPSHQGRGIGTRLVNEAMTMLRQAGAAGCVVLGEPAYYGRFGFRADARLVLPGVSPEHFQALLFRGTTPTGRVTYHDAFLTVG